MIKGPVGCFSDFLFASKCYPASTLALAHTFQPMASFTCTTHEPATLVLHIKGRVVKAAPPRSRWGSWTQGQDQMALSKAPVAEFSPLDSSTVLSRYFTLTSTIYPPPLKIMRRRPVGLRTFFKFCSFEVRQQILFVDPIVA